MNPVIIRAHFDGERIHLDEPCKLEPDSTILVTIISKESRNEDREEWLRRSEIGLSHAYGSEEPDYSVEMIKEVNPD